MENKYSSLGEAINGISSKMVFKKLNITDENKQEIYNDQEKLKVLLVEIKSNEEEVKNNINSIYNSVIKENSELETEKGLLLDIANYIAHQVEEKGITNPNQISMNSEMVSQVFKYNIDDISNNGEINNSKDVSDFEVLKNVAEFKITKEGLENFQNDMQERYEHNYFQTKDFEEIEKVNEEITEIVGKENLESLIENANGGDIEAARKLMIIQNAQIILASNSNVEIIPEDKLQDYLKEMILLSEYFDIPEAKTIYEKMSEKLPEDVWEKGEQEIDVVDSERLKQVYKSMNDGKDIDIDFLKEAYTDMAKQYVQNEDCQFTNGVNDFIMENIIEGQKRMLQKNICICMEEADKSPESYRYAMYELEQNSKKYLDASLRLAEEMSLSGIDPSEKEIFETLVGFVLDGLVEAKDGTEFVDDEYTKASKKNLFKVIITNKEFSSQELLEKNVRADSEVTKEILKEMLEEYNDTTDKTAIEIIQVLGDVIRQVSQEEKTIIDDCKTNIMEENVRNFEDEDDAR